MTINLHHTLLLTGAAGGLGKELRQRLKANCTVLRLSDRENLGTAGEGEEVVLADLADAATCISKKVCDYKTNSEYNPIPQAAPGASAAVGHNIENSIPLSIFPIATDKFCICE